MIFHGFLCCQKSFIIELMSFIQAKGLRSALRGWCAGFFSYGYGLNRVEAEELTADQQRALREQLQQIENEIANQQVILDQKKQEGQSITRDIAILNAQIKQAQLKIQAHAIAIKNLGKDITVKTNTITALNGRIGKSKESLSQIVQRTREIDNYSMAEALLSTSTRSAIRK